LDKQGGQKLEKIREWYSLTETMYEAMSDDIREAEMAVSCLTISYGHWARANAAGIKINRTACFMFHQLMYVPKIFDEPKVYSNVEIAAMSSCNPNTVPVALKQLEAAGLTITQKVGRKRSVLLSTPGKEVINAHEEWLKRFPTLISEEHPHMPFRIAFPKWKKFTAQFA
jgi:predicted MarR family transcription regulator